MEDISNWQESDLDKVVTADEKENTTLDYKDSHSLKFKDRTPARGYSSLGFAPAGLFGFVHGTAAQRCDRYASPP